MSTIRPSILPSRSLSFSPSFCRWLTPPRLDLKHLSVPHLHGQKHHHQRRYPDPSRAQPQDPRALTPNILLSGKWGHNSCQPAQTAQHATRTPPVRGAEQLRRARIQHGVEVRLHEVLERIESDVAGGGAHLRVHCHGETLADCGEDEGPFAADEGEGDGEEGDDGAEDAREVDVDVLFVGV